MDLHLDWLTSENVVLLNPRWPQEDQNYLRSHAERALRDLNLQSHVVVTSSGTTADSWRAVKLVFIAKKNLLAAAESVRQRFQFPRGTRFLQSLPSFHVGGLGIQARAHLVQGELAASLEQWSAPELLRRVQSENIHVLSLVPTQIHDLVVGGHVAPSCVREVFVGAGALSEDLEKKARDLGWKLVLSYGMTETAAMVATRDKIGVGYDPLPGVSGEINESGLLRIKAPGLATGWLSLRGDDHHWNPIDPVFGYQTQDRVRIEQNLWIPEGRDGDFVKIMGESVQLLALREIFSNLLLEECLLSVDFHLMAIPDERRGACVICVTSSAASDEKLEKLRVKYASRVLPFERIHGIFRVPQIPRTELGKVRESELLEMIKEVSGGVSWKK